MAYSEKFEILCKKCNMLSSVDDGLLIGIEYDTDMLANEMNSTRDIILHCKPKIVCSHCDTEWVEGEEMITTCVCCETIIREDEPRFSCEHHEGLYCKECAAETYCTVLVKEDEECCGVLLESWQWGDLKENNYEEDM